MDYKENYKRWMEDDYFDKVTKDELKTIENNEPEIKERFYKNLEFGTGGMRGIMGAGTNRINVYTVRRATQGLANYILMQEGDVKSMGVALAYDSRRMSAEFAREAALVMNGNGIKSYIFEDLRPTPMLSFAVRQLGCVAGIVITASHNPPEYNGYKAYWSDGGQIPYPRDEAIIEEVNKVNFSQIKRLEKEEAEKAGLYNVISNEIDDAFVENVKAQSLNPQLINEMGRELTIVYTPLHGSGNKPVRRVLKEAGFENVHVVPEQEMPDGNFSTVGYPNPEDPKAFALGMKLADELNADLVVGTDPDADRVGAVIKKINGEYMILNGNMMGSLLTEYILSQRKLSGNLPENGAIISTIVSTDMTKEITERYGMAYMEVLTGFKYIGEKIKQFEETGSYKYIFGFEESYGCLSGTYARDKDAVVATLLICELAAFYKKRGLTLYEGLQELYEKYGFYRETIESITFPGIAGLESMKAIMTCFRENPPKKINKTNVAEVRDYKTGLSKNIITGEERKIDLPMSDVLYFTLEDGGWFAIRPSGTEPKIKIYFGSKGETAEQAESRLQDYVRSVMEIVKANM